MYRILAIGLVWLAFGPAASAWAQSAVVELVMFESDACPFCQQWNAEIGGIYAETPEGRAAPLRRVDLHEKPPDDLRNIQRSVIYTPTFVLLRQGEEIGRIAGYPGEHFFWPLLDNLLDEAGGSKN
ncbi:thioredoxin domain-containing protein [Algihabitans albus]|uniref:hypothetical protein n=1 Tax=Algihabitans albus TaxID=2164067 RepID=UPI000E5C943E|nr:hypothetical protein [Algihabitans albus]